MTIEFCQSSIIYLFDYFVDDFYFRSMRRKKTSYSALGSSAAVEDYLERILELINSKGYARVVDIAAALKISPAVTDVAQDEIVAGVRERRERRLSVGDCGDVVPGAQQAREIVPHVRVIVRHQNPRRPFRDPGGGSRPRRRHRVPIVGGIGQPAQGFADE